MEEGLNLKKVGVMINSHLILFASSLLIRKL